MGYDDIVWFTYPYLDKDPIGQFIQYVDEREQKDIKTKLGDIKVLGFDSFDGDIVITTPELVGEKDYDSTDVSDWRNALFCWQMQRTDFLKKIGIPVSLFNYMVELKEFSLLSELITTLKRYKAEQEIVLRLIRVPDRRLWVIRAVMGQGYIETPDIEVLENALTVFKSTGTEVEPINIIVTKKMTIMRFLVPKYTFTLPHSRTKDHFTLGIEVRNSEVGKGRIKLAIICAVGDDHGIIRIPFKDKSKLSHRQTTKRDLIARYIVYLRDLLSVLENFKEELTLARHESELLIYDDFKVWFLSLRDQTNRKMLQCVSEQWDGGTEDPNVSAKQFPFDYGIACAKASVEGDFSYRQQMILEGLAGLLIFGERQSEWFE